MTSQATADLLAHTTALLAKGVDSSMASRTTLALVSAALDERGIDWTPHAGTLLIGRSDGTDLTVYWEGRWCYRVNSPEGSDLEYGSLESLGDVLRLACEVQPPTITKVRGSTHYEWALDGGSTVLLRDAGARTTAPLDGDTDSLGGNFANNHWTRYTAGRRTSDGEWVEGRTGSESPASALGKIGLDNAAVKALLATLE